MKKATLLVLPVTVIILLSSACAVTAGSTAAATPGLCAAEATKPIASASQTPDASATPVTTVPAADIIEQTITFLLHGQEDKPEAGKLHWTQGFLVQVDADAVYADYLADGGKADDVLGFAEYLTENAPVPDNWKQLFEATLLEEYGVTPSRYEELEDGFYHVFIKDEEGNEISYVAVNPRTGYFHG